ncbi:hypothetical protein MAE02_60860 [Microvirga aerophila]|uniref:Uncharacterized protein n=1 Tax=Microvirga aerophila TaxID=670291 RepID=A0A512C2G2_9HYPH|nr:hypothetical protein MAE02_60860 [Microvirga aerophila]
MGLAAVETPVATVKAARAGTVATETAARLGVIRPGARQVEATPMPGTRAEAVLAQVTQVQAMRAEVTQVRATKAVGAKAALAQAAQVAGPPEA